MKRTVAGVTSLIMPVAALTSANAAGTVGSGFTVSRFAAGDIDASACLRRHDDTEVRGG
jgi:hypothetical protein